MCGRYVNVASTSDLTEEFDVEETIGDDLSPSWNIAPTDPVRVVVKRHPSDDRDAPPIRQLRTVQWGLVPNWSRSRTGSTKMINARSETVATKPAFKAAAARRRCLAPALGYFEWMRDSGPKIPYFLHAANDVTFAMAGLYEVWHDDSLPEDDPKRWLWTCTIITRPASDALGHVHDRCPVLVPREMQEAWLDCSGDDPRIAERLLADMPELHLELRRVSKAVGNVKNNGPELVEPVPDAPDDVLPIPLDDATATKRSR
jgi:putative SOS response-associated peptidase YedK